MADTVTPEVRSRIMAAVRSKDTKPEMAIRRGLHALGYRYVLHSRGLPGRPDLAFPRFRAVIFIEGCFWHGHEGCRLFRLPSSRAGYWREKIARNVERDRATRVALDALGWRHLTVWECAIRGKGAGTAVARAAEWLASGEGSAEIKG